MRHVINVGTDVASLCFFDAAALPADVDERLKKHYDKVGRDLAQKGRVGWIDHDSDGGYIMHFYVDEPVPERVRRYAENPREIDRLQVPGGTLWACGAEYLAKDPFKGPRRSGGLGRYPHMSGQFTLPAGDYAATVWNVEWPEGAEEDAIDQALSPADAALRRRLNFTMGYVLMAVFGLGAVLLFTAVRGLLRTSALPSWHLWGWPIFAGLLAIVFLGLRKLNTLQPATDRIARDFPSFVVHLRRLAAES